MSYSRRIPAAIFFSLALLAPAAQAQAQAARLGHSGQLQRVLAGTYGELFAPGDDAGDATPVLAVETVATGADVKLALVPGTDDARLESAPALFQDPRHDAFVLLWRSQGEDGDTRLDFATFDGAEWSEVLTLERDGAPVSLPGELKIAETHNAFELELEDGESVRAARLSVHLLWQEGEDAAGTYYAPLTFVEGRYVGWHGVFALDESFLQAPADAGAGDDGTDGDDAPVDVEPVELSAGLARVHDLRVSGTEKSVLVTFSNSASDRIGSLEIAPLPLEIGLLAEQVREHVLALADLYNPDDLSFFSDGIRSAIVIIGQRYKLHDAHAGYVADQVADWLLADGGTYGWAGLENLGLDARDLTIDVTREVYLSTSADSADPGSDILRIDVSGLFDDQGEPAPAQVFDFRTRADLPAPAVGEAGLEVFTSSSSGDLLIAWEDVENGQIHWLESRDGAWSEVFSLNLDDRLTVEVAHRLLAKRVR